MAVIFYQLKTPSSTRSLGDSMLLSELPIERLKPGVVVKSHRGQYGAVAEVQESRLAGDPDVWIQWEDNSWSCVFHSQAKLEILQEAP